MTEILFFNGSFVDEHDAKVPVSDRGFLYGDGLFETVRIYSGKPFQLKAHWERLACGAEFLKINLPYSFDQVEAFTNQLIEKNNLSEAVLRITLSRGSGKRGYSIAGADRPTLVMSLHPLPSEIPESITLHTSSLHISKNDPLVRFKTANKLQNILAKTEAEENGANEALMLNSDGEVTCSSSGNIFWIKNGTVFTPPAEAGILPGITRAVVIELLNQSKTPFREMTTGKRELLNCDGCFITNSVLEIVPVSQINGQTMDRSPIVAQLQSSYKNLVQKEVSLD